MSSIQQPQPQNEILASSLKCNACWTCISSGSAYKTVCNHLFCNTCSKKHFGRRMVCPLCDTDLSQDGGLLELIADGTHEIARATYSYMAFHPETAFPIMAESVEFSRGQIALYGTRAVWIRAKEVESLLLRKTEIENLLNTRTHELSMKTAEAMEMTSKLQSKQTECEDLKRRLANASVAFSGVTGKALPSMPPLQLQQQLQQHQQQQQQHQQQQQQQQRYPQQQTGFGGDMTPRRVSSPSAAMGGSSVMKSGGIGSAGVGGGGRGIYATTSSSSHVNRAPTPDKSLSVRTSTSQVLNLIRPQTAAGVQQKGGYSG